MVRLDTGDKPDRKLAGTVFRLPNPPGPIGKEILAAAQERIVVPPLSAALVVMP